MTVQITFNDTEEYSFKSIAILGCNIYSKITVAHVILPKAVLSTVKVFALYLESNFSDLYFRTLDNQNSN